MFTYIIQGFLLGLAYVAPIGTQNLYVINSAIRMSRLKALRVALFTVFFDISLALACYFGVGFLLEKNLILKKIILLIGGLMVTFIGIKLILSKPSVSSKMDMSESLIKIIGISFVVTWFNPQAILDGSVLFGGIRSTLTTQDANYFVVGVSMASFFWFTSLSLITSIFRHVMNTRVLRLINLLCGIIIVFYGIKLGLNFFIH